MNEKEVFEELFRVAQQSKDPRGVVAACLVKDGKIVASAPSSDDGDEHAENALLNNFQGSAKGMILYCTLEPCTARLRTKYVDCVSAIIGAGITSVVYGARDPGQSELAQRRCKEAGVSLVQIEGKEIIKKCAELFNDTVDPRFSQDEAPRKPLA